MSHAYVEIVHDGKIIGYSEYNGTVDVMHCNIWYDTETEQNDHWRNHGPWTENCDCTPVEVIIYSNYGGGFWWRAPACLEHRIILHNLSPDGPDWFKRDQKCEHSPLRCSGDCLMIELTDGHPLGQTREQESTKEVMSLKTATTVVAILVVGLIAVSSLGIRATRTAEYWRKQYDQENHLLKLANLPLGDTDACYQWKPSVMQLWKGDCRDWPTITLTKTCIDKYGSETIGWAHAEIVPEALSPYEGALKMRSCPEGTVDAEVYIGTIQKSSDKTH